MCCCNVWVVAMCMQVLPASVPSATTNSMCFHLYIPTVDPTGASVLFFLNLITISV